MAVQPREKENLLTIGEVAQLSGVPVKTIRHYSDVGVLPPSAVSHAGYRLYTETDRARLDLIRALRAVGFDLVTISQLLEGELSSEDAVQLQLEAVEVHLRALRRQRSVLRATLRGGKSLDYLNRVQVLSRLEAIERHTFVAAHMERGLAGVPVDREWSASLWQTAMGDLPDELDEAQLDAWLELADLVTDEDFHRSLARQTHDFWAGVTPGFDVQAFAARTDEVFHRAETLLMAGKSPASPEAQEVTSYLIQINAEALGRQDDPALPAWLLERYGDNHDRRAERFWEFVAVIRGWETPPPRQRVHYWLVEALHHWISAHATPE